MKLISPTLVALIFATSLSAQSNEPNNLLGQDSPYLLQHLYNEVDWYPWGEEALEKARAEGKPIFLSIGYSSCHWCHVMEEESFENAEIGAFLNENFVAIKVDRERRPDLDEQFMLVTQSLAGAGGWPNSVFLTSAGDPFYAGTYYPPDTFLSVITQIDTAWRSDDGALAASAAEFSQIIRNYMDRAAAAYDLTPEAVRAAAYEILGGLDEFNGGMGVSPKFPRESMFLFLLNQAERDGDKILLAAVTDALDGMVKGGIHDHVGGGFHRYSVDPEWHVPHFEKMLYNQAMIGRLMVRGWRITGEIRYRRAAERTFDYVLREMQSPQGGFYSAQDADSLTPTGELEEGAYYAWTPAEIRAVLSEPEAIITAFNINEDGNFEGSNSIHILDFADDEVAFFNTVDPMLTVLRDARSTRSAPLTDRKIIVDWNAMMIETLAEAAYTFDRPDYFSAAVNATNYIWDNMMSDGQLVRVSFEDSASITAQLSDYAGLGLAMVALHDYTSDDDAREVWLSKARTLADEMLVRFGEEDNAYRMTEVSDGIGILRPTSDTEIPAGNALALALLVDLGKRSPAPILTQRATVLSALLSSDALASPRYSLIAGQNLILGEIGQVQYLASGAVRVESSVLDGVFTAKITVRDGWHINAHIPLEDYFIPTDLTIGDTPLAATDYPAPLVKPLAFNPKPLALYEGSLELSAEITGKGVAVLSLQACSDEICLQPEEARFTIW